MSTNGQNEARKIHDRLKHPVIDVDGHRAAVDSVLAIVSVPSGSLAKNDRGGPTDATTIATRATSDQALQSCVPHLLLSRSPS